MNSNRTITAVIREPVQVEAVTRNAGHDTTRNLFIDGGDNRDITIHAEKKS